MPQSSPKDERQRATQAAEWWLKLREAEPTPEQIAAWIEWRGRDPRNAEAFERAQAFSGRLAATDPKTLSGLAAEFAAPQRRGASSWLRWPTLRLAIAASAVLAISFAGYRLLTDEPVPEPSGLEYRTPVATNRDIPLPDGSQVALGAASVLNARFGDDARRIDLGDGEAFFKVKHEERRAFYVRAGRLTVRAVGTAFDVRKTGERVVVTVTEGRVRVAEGSAGAGAQGDASANAVEVAAGQQVAYGPGAAGLRVAKVDAGSAVAWRENRLEFVNEPLESVVANINRYSARPLRIADPAVGRLSFTGTVSLRSLDRWLAALQTVFPVRVESVDAGVVIAPLAPS